MHTARKPADRAADQRHAELAFDEVDSRELVFDLLRREAAGDLGLFPAEDAHAEFAGRGDRVVRLHGFLDAHQHQRRVERQRGEGRDRQAVRLPLMLGRHHGHAAGEVGHGQLERRVVDEVRHWEAEFTSNFFLGAAYLGGTGGLHMRRTLTIALVFAITTAAHAATDTIRRGFKVGDGGTLHLDAGIGSIKLVTGGEGVAFEVIRDARGTHDDEELREHKITFSQQGNDVYVESEFEHSRNRWFSDYDVQWNIRVPAHYSLDVKTSGGSIDLSDVGGTVEAHTSGGWIKTGNLGGPATLKTSGGSISVNGARGNVIAHTSGGSITVGDADGPVDAKTSGGSITITRADGDVVAHTSGGSIRIDDVAGTVNASTSGGSINARLSRQPKGDSRLTTSGGGVSVTLASNIAVELDAHASGGGVHSDVPVTVVGEQDDDSLQGSINGGGPKLVLRSSGGGIRVRPIS